MVEGLRLVEHVGCPHCFHTVKPFVEATEEVHIKVLCPRKECGKAFLVERRWSIVEHAEEPR